MCYTMDRIKGLRTFILPQLNFTHTFSWGIQPSGATMFNVTLWRTPGKFGFFNIYSGEYDQSKYSEVGDIYRWDVSDWKMDPRFPMLIKSELFHIEELMRKETHLLLTSAISFYSTLLLHSRLGAGEMMDFENIADYKKYTKGYPANFYFFMPYMYNQNGTYSNIYNGKLFNDNNWCSGQPNSLEETCITCRDECCYDSLCTQEYFSFYAVNPKAMLTLR